MGEPLVAKYAAALADWKSGYFTAPSQDLRAMLKRIAELEEEVKFAWSDECDPLADDNKTLRAKLTKLEALCAAQAKALVHADSLTMLHRATRMAGQPVPALDAYDAAKAELERVR
jgi:diadenosine tetraphosphate (Ap4A) HIT family hydrolase